MKTVALVVIPIVILALLTPLTNAESVQESSVTIYRDGFVHVKFIVSVNETSASITLPLLSSNITNILVYDEKGEPLNYEIKTSSEGGTAEANIEIYSLGATLVKLEYDTAWLTSKVGTLWTFAVNSPFELSVILPENSTVMYLSAPPKLITMDGQKIKIVFYPGYCEVSYDVTSQGQPSLSSEQPTIWYATAGVVSVIIILIIFKIRKKKVVDALGEDERKVVEFIKKNGNRALEAELREAFPGIPRTSMWRLLKRLEKQGVIRIKRIGLQNLVELV